MKKLLFLSILFWLGASSLSLAQFYNGSNQAFGKNRVQHDDFFWYYFKFQKYNIYFYAGGRNIAEYTARTAPKIQAELENAFDYTLGEKIHFIVYNKIGQYHQSNVDYVEEEFNTGGQTQLSDSKIFLYYEGDYNELDIQIRKGLAAIIMNKMMYGDNWKEVIKNSALLNIPDWYVNGLVSYASRPWGPDISNRIFDGYQSRKYKRFNRLEGQDAELAGHSIWKYIEDVYGKKVIPNIVYMARVSRNVESGFLFVLGLSLKKLINDCDEHYRLKAANLDLIKVPAEDKIKFKTKKKFVYRNLIKAPGSDKIAFITNRMGRHKVHIYDPSTGKKKVVARGGTKLQRVNDLAKPVLLWAPEGERLGIITERKSDSWLTLIDLERKEKVKRPIYQLEKILSADFSPNGKHLVISAIKRGQTDLYKFTYASSVLKQLTDDIYDDLEPEFTLDGKSVLFSSNRKNDTLQFGVKANENLLGKKDIYLLTENGRTSSLRQITNTPDVDERQAFEDKEGRIVFIADESGVVNRHTGSLDSTISHIDTVIHYRRFTNIEQISDYTRNVLEQDFDPASGTVTQLMYNDGRFVFHTEDLKDQIQRSKEKASSKENDALNNGPIRDIFLELKPIAVKALPFKENVGPDSIDVSNYQFISVKNNAPVKRGNKAVVFGKPKVTESLQINKTPLVMPNQRNYSMNFTATNMVSAIDFNFANQLYQPFNGGPYVNPGTGMVLKVGVLDLFEDYKIEGGLRVGFNGLNIEYFLTLDNRSKRLDKRYSFQRQTLTQIDAILGTAVDLHINHFKYILKWPFSETFAIRGTASVRSDRTVFLSTEKATALINDVYEFRAGVKAELIYDNVREKGLNLYHGTRFKIFAERYQLTNHFDRDLNVIGFDFRHYQKIHRDMIFASRLAASTSLGYEKLIYYLGSVDNWVLLSNRPRFDTQTQIAQDQNYRFQTIATSMRGFIQNVRNGNTFAVITNEIRWPVFRYFLNRPLKSEFTSNFAINFFSDIGSAWTGWNPYSKSNQFNTYVINANPMTIYLDNKKDPLVGSYGIGFRAKLWGYFIRYDYAWGIEDRRIQKPISHISFSLDF